MTMATTCKSERQLTHTCCTKQICMHSSCVVNNLSLFVESLYNNTSKHFSLVAKAAE